MNNPLQTFYQNEPERTSVKEFLIEILKELAVDKTFSGKETTGIRDAKDCIEKAFDKLEEMFEVKKAPIISNSR